MQIRNATENDLLQITQLFSETIKTVNRKDYSEEQITVWSGSSQNSDFWLKNIETQFFVVAEKDGLITGFASMDDNACVDLMYIHKDFQNMGIATNLLNALELKAYEKEFRSIWSDVSITAKPFFLKKGFKETKVYTKKVHHIAFENTIMIKVLDKS